MSNVTFRVSDACPAGWGASLITEPGEPWMVCLTRRHRTHTAGGVIAVHHLTLDQAQALARHLHAAVKALQNVHETRTVACPAYSGGLGFAPWSVFAARRSARDAYIDIQGWMGDFPGNRVQIEHRLSTLQADRLVGAIDGLLATLDPPLRAAVAPLTPLQRAIPEFVRAPDSQETCRAH